MGLHSILNSNDNSVIVRENIQKLIYLLLADRILNSRKIFNDLHCEVNLTEVINRNSELISVFPEFFEDLQVENLTNQMLLSEINSFLTEASSELLHIPGRVHEMMLSKSVSAERKKQGSYYTPPYIIKYMFDMSLDYLMPNNKFQFHNLKILDPACGGASFLIEFLHKLIDSGVPAQAAIESIYGIDIDHQAVLTSIFALTLAVKAKAPCVESLQYIKQLWMSQIKKGNALCKIGGNISEGIDWPKCYPSVFKNNGREPGFDIIIGNPPYVSNKLIPTMLKKYYRDNYRTASGQYDLSVLFIEQGMDLLKKDGVLSYITSNKFMAADYGLNLRQQLVNSCEICEIVDVSTLKSFKNTSVYPVIICAKKSTPCQESITRIFSISSWEELKNANPVLAGRNLFKGNSSFIITTRLNSDVLPIIRKIEDAGHRIPSDSIHCGIARSGFSRWVKKEDQIPINEKSNYHPFIQAGHINRYSIDSDVFIDLTCFSSQKWLSIKGPKLVFPGIAKYLTAAIDFEERLVGRVYFICQGDTDYDLYYLAVLFNSYVLNLYYSILYWSVHLQGGYLRFNSTYLANLPIIPISTILNAELINSIKDIGTELASGHLTDNMFCEKQCLANALTFELYGISADQAQLVMNFLCVPENIRDKVLSILINRYIESPKLNLEGVL